MFWEGSLRKKIQVTMVAVVGVMLLGVGIFSVLAMSNISNLFIESNQATNEAASEKSLNTLTKSTKDQLLELASNKADIVDKMFQFFEDTVNIVADEAEYIYGHADRYSDRPGRLPSVRNDGRLSVQLLYAPDTDPDDPEVRKEMLLIGNISDTLYAVNKNVEEMVSNYVATESGIVLQADYISGMKFDDEGKILPLDAKERPWYQGAVATGKTYLSPVIKDYHTGRPTVTCGVPIYSNGKLMGVSGAGIYLDNVETLVKSIDLGINGDACIINRSGQILFSTSTDGAFSKISEIVDLRSADNADLASLTRRALAGGTGVDLLNVDGEMQYIAFAPMKTVGWTFFIMMPQSEVERPVIVLKDSLEEMQEQAKQAGYNTVNTAIVLLLITFAAAIAAAVLIAYLLSKQIVKPIQKLTEEVQAVEGNNLDFHWDMDTKDETQVLAASFESLTERMKTYISDLQNITAERERMETEMYIATDIQSSMLPNRFPAFPDRNEFDIYAYMHPAREVGGDFYDFFLIDEDHLGLVIADVSGKGVPAALLMMATKIMIKASLVNGRTPDRALAEANVAVLQNNRGMFVTVWVGILELSTGNLIAANAGHEYPVLKRAGGAYELIKDTHSFIVGGMEDIKYKNYEWKLEPGDKLFLYTDGVPEAVDTDVQMFGTDRLLAVLNEDPDASPQDTIDNMCRALDEFVGEAEQFDDITMLSVDYFGNQSESRS